MKIKIRSKTRGEQFSTGEIIYYHEKKWYDNFLAKKLKLFGLMLEYGVKGVYISKRKDCIQWEN